MAHNICDLNREAVNLANGKILCGQYLIYQTLNRTIKFYEGLANISIYKLYRYKTKLESPESKTLKMSKDKINKARQFMA